MTRTLLLPRSPEARLTLAILALLLVLRVIAILSSPLNLYADEAQYWRWSQELAWGYYSKPPMIAWIIHAMTALFGDTEWAVRLAAPFLHTVAAGFLFLAGRAMFTAKTGLYAALLYALMPAVTLSSSVLSTDGVLMPFWCAGLYLAWRLRAGGGLATAAALGAALGLGILSKYAMLYFLIGLALACLADAPMRRAVASRGGALAAGVMALLVAPHFAWNAANDFQTVGHTVDNANLGGDLFHPENAITFILDQMGVFGPVSFGLLAAGLAGWRTAAAGDKAPARWLLCFVVPVLVFILGQAVLSRAHANWAATAYPGASLLVAGWFASRHALIRASIGANALIALFFLVVPMLPVGQTRALGIDNALKRTRGWDQAAEQLFAEAGRVGATAVLVDEREAWHGLDFYGRGRSVPLISWRRYQGPKSFSERVPLEGAAAGRVLVASLHPGMRPRLRSDFGTFEPAGQIRIPLGVRGNGCPITRVFQLYIASDYNPPERTADWEARFDGQKEFAEPPCPAKD
ncbi:MAG: phospholipid carrier-dependent glycosyltransferase [Hyphomonas sp.]|uniref:ArnT family glycosyltransferase n=1 Tax=Hyphomonas sp. TaxID=87 RepID=UPI0017AD50F7|nr:glycosyltransferase family 39 protein [Hyphomonas sp.]MBA3069395.1 phospholipid carrier-dependent glycosyltransferase [Hyphomonas sp.]MBU3921593.1 glycosyltransferase family 39 protein [Alphaproteobacteria bacterium]MBU4063777.1 glycosyltransferase family 39 protein [Alphaproteobacteria bacterium]MBU4164262.1 glycosyltransferase family 39 protein [Alphaproteobacteria bacterium]